MDSTQGKDSHPVSLKVLRLSRPSLTQKFPLPSDSRGTQDDPFLLDSTLTLPPSFGQAYVGQPFSCTLCANNELDTSSPTQVSNLKLVAEMQTPSGTLALDLDPQEQTSGLLKADEPVQRNLRFDLREEGSHTLAINISYSETIISKDHAASGRVRTFRKLYQFTARPCLNVRTKVSQTAGDASILALEAQIDNLADGAIVLRNVTFNCKAAFKSTSLNWDSYPVKEDEYSNNPIMAPREVYQVAFMIQEIDGGPKKESLRDGRVMLGQLGLRWASEMGEDGFLTTGMLTTKRR